MSARAIVPILCMSSAAMAAPAYPIPLPKVDEAQLAARREEFVQRNPEHWLSVETDPHGFIRRVVTDDPTLVPTLTSNSPGVRFWSKADLAKLRRLLRANADLFGFSPGTVERLVDGTGTGHVTLTDTVDDVVLGEIDVMPAAIPVHDPRQPTAPPVSYTPTLEISARFWLDVSPRLTADAVARRVVGHSYRVKLEYAAAAQLDCNMPPRPGACLSQVEHVRSRDVVLTRDALSTRSLLLADKASARLVVCVDSTPWAPPPPDPTWQPHEIFTQLAVQSVAFTPLAGSPALPLVVDAVTGAVVPTHARSCAASELVDARD